MQDTCRGDGSAGSCRRSFFFYRAAAAAAPLPQLLWLQRNLSGPHLRRQGRFCTVGSGSYHRTGRCSRSCNVLGANAA